MSKMQDLTGQKFNKLSVISRSYSKERVAWNCICDCGNSVIVKSYHLKNGEVKSCGCLNHKPKHNLTKTRIHRIWVAMRQRCNNENNDRYYIYGGRGISVCEEWDNKKDGFLAFKKWADENGYSDNLTIDRIDSDGNYSPENCRWATRETQTINRKETGKNNKTGIVGVYEAKSGGYYAQIMYKYKPMYLGHYDNIEDAKKARKEAKKKYHEKHLAAV